MHKMFLKEKAKIKSDIFSENDNKLLHFWCQI